MPSGWVFESGIYRKKAGKACKEELSVSDDCRSLTEYLEKFDLPGQCLRDERGLEEAGFDVLKSMSRENVCYAEIRFAPLFSETASMSCTKAIEAFLKGMEKGKQTFGIEYGLIICAMRHHSEEENRRMIKAAREFLGAGVCAVGGVNLNYKPGDFMLITDHIATAIPSPLIGENLEELGTRFPDMSEVYSLRMQGIIKAEAEKLEIPLRERVYVQFTGPAYETPAEIRMCRSWGGDAVGMSTACEAVAAKHMGMETCGISCITNMAAGISKEPLNHKEVQETADRVAVQFKELITAVVENI